MTRTVLRAADLPPPRPITESDFESICGIFGIAAAQQPELRAWLADAVAGFDKTMTAQRNQPSRKADRQALERAVKTLQRARHHLQRKAGPAGRAGLRVAGRQLAPALSGSWMRRRFPDDPLAPDPVYMPSSDVGFRRPYRVPSRPADVDELQLQQRLAFMEGSGAAALVALLGDIIAALEEGRRDIVALPDGRTPIKHRDYMLAALAEVWSRLHHRPTSGRNSEFGAFAECVFEAIGWPTEGVNSSLPSSIRLWRALYGR